MHCPVPSFSVCKPNILRSSIIIQIFRAQWFSFYCSHLHMPPQCKKSNCKKTVGPQGWIQMSSSPRVSPGIWNPLEEPVVQVCGMSRGQRGLEKLQHCHMALGGRRKNGETGGRGRTPSIPIRGAGDHGASGEPKGQLGAPGNNRWSKGASMVAWGKLGQMTITGAPKGTVGVLGKMEESGRVSG